MNESDIYHEVRALAGNLASTWNGGLPVLQRITGAAEEPSASPWSAMLRLGEEGIEKLFAAGPDREELRTASQRLTEYLSAETWFDRAKHIDPRLEPLAGAPVAYFCAEFGLASWLPIYSGGLGVLAGDVLKESSDMGLPLVAVGLFYRHGFFFQQMDDSDRQTEVYPTLNPADLPLTEIVDEHGKALVVDVPVAGRTIHARVWCLQVGRTPLYLLDTDVPENERQEDREITAKLYGGDQETRLQQELVLGIGGVRALGALGVRPSVFSMNEGHAAFLGVELLAEELGRGDFQTGLQRTRSHVVYTNHTVVPAGNDVFPRELVRSYLEPYAAETGIGVDRLFSLGASGTGDTFSMAVLAFQLSGKANAVSQLHGEIVPREWPGFAVEAVTNGVHVPTWVGPQIEALLDRHVPDWRSDDPDLSRVHAIPDEELQSAHADQRRAMIEYVNEAQTRVTLDPDRLTLVWARRFAEYKRAWLLVSDMARLARLVRDPKRPLQIVISGKAHPRDDAGKRVLQNLLRRIKEDAQVAARVAFVPDYSLEVASMLTQGADVWVNTPRKPLEASGTSGMKASDNGALQLTVQDGWAAEVDWWDVGWGIIGQDDAADQLELYRFLEEGVVRCYYDRDDGGIARHWVSMMKRTMVLTLSRYSARRMLLEYLKKLYLPLLEQQRESNPDGR